SCVVLQSLRQSREQWMYLVFPRFSGRVRGKSDTVPPPHTIQSRGRCQIEIGPHIFSDTTFFEVQYMTPTTAPTPPFLNHRGNRLRTAPIHQNAPAIQHSTSPLLSSLTSVTTITPALINQVNSAAASNPTLANLLQLAAAGKASPEQLKTLGLLIQSLAVPESSEALTSAANLMKSTPQAYPSAFTDTSVKDFDLVFQFQETSYERWILPRGPVICEKVADTRTTEFAYDIVLTLALQLPGLSQGPPEVANTDKSASQVVSIRLKRPPPAIWETIWRWVGGEEKLNENRIILDNLKKQTQRLYLAHRLPQNALLTQLQSAAAPNFLMKSIKPSPVTATKAKRKPVQRKPAQNVLPGYPQAGSRTQSLGPNTAPEPKRRKISKTKQNVTPISPIRCVSCGDADIPLLLGGRELLTSFRLLINNTISEGFCRPCVDSGKGTAVYVPYRPPQQTYQAPATTVYTPSPLSSSLTSSPAVDPSASSSK
ncbi:hypothetical protein B0H10DRAFT_1790444, partial [Mycena sp. CBHHK59/15]